MKKLALSLAAVCSLLLAGVTAAFAAGVTDYQVTGPVTAVTDTTITVMKGKESWELAKDASTKGAAEVKVGDKVTVHYTMTATTVEAKPAAGTAKKTADKPAAAAKKPAAAASATPATSTEGAKPAAGAAPGSSPTAN